MMCFLSRWARRLSWRETARAFHTSWECVYRSVEWFVQWGLAHRQLEGVGAIGVDEIHWGKSKRADNFLTVIYQIDSHCRRLLWVGKRRTQATLRRGLAALGPEVVGGTAFCVQRHVAALLECPGRQGGPGAARAGPLPHHLAFEPGSGPGAAGRERSFAGRGLGPSSPAQKTCAGNCSGAAAGCAGGPEANWAGCCAPSWRRRGPGRSKTSSNTSGRINRSLARRRLSGLLDLARPAQPHGTDEEGGADAAHA